jgi:hypothetical protein
MKIYEKLGITKDQYIYRIRKDLLPRKKRKNNGRFSGLEYKNSQEKLEAIRQKYADGVTSEHLQELYEKIGGQERIF